MSTWVELDDNDAQHLRQHLRDALALHTYNDSWEQMAQRVWAAIDEGLLRTETPAPNITLAAEIKPGHRYLLNTDRMMTPEQADKAMAVLQERFPGSTFAVAYGIKLVETQNLLGDLRDALKRAVDALDERRNRRTQAGYRGQYVAAMMALDALRQELFHPERDGAGALPDPSEPVAATYPPAPSRPPRATCICPDNGFEWNCPTDQHRIAWLQKAGAL